MIYIMPVVFAEFFFLSCGFPGYKPVPPGWFKICVGFITGTPKGSPKVVYYGEAGIRTYDPWFTRHSAYPLHHGEIFF